MADKEEKDQPTKTKQEDIHIGKRIKQIREQAGMTQAEFADEIGIGQPHLSRIEREESEPSMEVLRKIARRFHSGDLLEVIRGTKSVQKLEAVLESDVQKWAYCLNKKCPNAQGLIDSGGGIGLLGFTGYRAVPAFDESGEENIYCDACGAKLIRACPECGRKIRSNKQTFCAGCGHRLFGVEEASSSDGDFDDTDPFADK
jgi:DNA-binding XRE family transcriptional regulator